MTGVKPKTDRQICLSQPEAADLHRRHPNAYQRSEIVLKLKPVLQEKAKERQVESGGAVPQKSVKPPIDTQKELAKIANVSERKTMLKATKRAKGADYGGRPSKLDGNRELPSNPPPTLAELGGNRQERRTRLIDWITLGDNVDVLPAIESKSIDLIFTDPPYITALADLYKSWNSRNMDWEFYAVQFNRILKNSGQIAVFCDLPTAVAITNAFQKYFKFRFFYVWVKSNGQPVNKMQPRSNVELILVWKKQKTLTGDLTFNPIMRPGEPYRKAHKAGNSTRKQAKSYETINETGQRWPEQTLYYPSKDNLPMIERTAHPCQKPVNLVGYLIRTLSNEGDLILDPFSGSGSTAIACHRLKRKFICIEKDPDFYIESVGRLERERCQIALPF